MWQADPKRWTRYNIRLRIILHEARPPNPGNLEEQGSLDGCSHLHRLHLVRRLHQTNQVTQPFIFQSVSEPTVLRRTHTRAPDYVYYLSLPSTRCHSHGVWGLGFGVWGLGFG